MKMSDLISRQDTYEVLTEYYHHTTDVQHDALREALDNVPSAEPERKKGEWIVHLYKLGRERYECSECTGRCDLGYNFCPNCGADMRGDHE